jgi:hypothetical protein
MLPGRDRPLRSAPELHEVKELPRKTSLREGLGFSRREFSMSFAIRASE